jgi:hypothetical protein
VVQWLIPNTVIAFQKTSTSLIQPEFKYVLPKSKVYLGTEMQHQYEDEDPFYNPQLSVNPYQNATSQNPNDPSAVFVNENALNIEQSRFVKQISWMQKSITLPNFEQSILNVTAGNTNAFQSYNSSILQILQDH